MKWFYKLTGGRPMKRQGFAFVDVITSRNVYYYMDGLGRKWMATSAWSLSRVQTFQ